MQKTGSLLAGALTVAVGLVVAMPASQAAWWDFGAKNNATAAGGGDNGVQLAQASGDAERMSRIEAQMRNLTGQIEQLTHTLGELQAQLKRMQDDNEFRFKSLESAAAASAAKGPVATPPAAGSAPAPKGQASAPAAAGSVPLKGQAVAPAVASPPATAALPPASVVPGAGNDAIGTLAAGDAAPQPQAGTAGPGAPPRPLGTVTLNAPPAGSQGAQPAPADQPLDLSALARGGGVVADSPPLPQAVPPDQKAVSIDQKVVPTDQKTIPTDQKAVAVAAPTGDPQADYKRAYELFVSGQYAASEASFRQFLTAYPSDDRASDATYWLGQTLYSRGMYREAALEFVNGHKLFPKSLRAADTMLLLGKSLAGIPERDAACQTFAAALKQYPQMAPTLHQRIASEQANAGC